MNYRFHRNHQIGYLNVLHHSWSPHSWLAAPGPGICGFTLSLEPPMCQAQAHVASLCLWSPQCARPRHMWLHFVPGAPNAPGPGPCGFTLSLEPLMCQAQALVASLCPWSPQCASPPAPGLSAPLGYQETQIWDGSHCEPRSTSPGRRVA